MCILASSSVCVMRYRENGNHFGHAWEWIKERFSTMFCLHLVATCNCIYACAHHTLAVQWSLILKSMGSKRIVSDPLNLTKTNKLHWNTALNATILLKSIRFMCVCVLLCIYLFFRMQQFPLFTLELVVGYCYCTFWNDRAGVLRFSFDAICIQNLAKFTICDGIRPARAHSRAAQPNRYYYEIENL